MASRVIITDFCRASYVHLKEKHAMNAQQEAKYRLSLMFPQDNVLPPHISAAGHPASCGSIVQALDEVCMEQFNGMNFQQTVQAYQIQFPPKFKDGNQDFKKNEQGMLTQEVKPASAGMWILNVTSDDPVGCVDHMANDVDVGIVYSGCWIKAELEVSAYVNKQGAPIIAIKLCNVQKCYDDENLGGGRVQQAASKSFAGQQITDSNCQVGVGQQFNQAPAAAPAAPAAPTMPGNPAAPAAPTMPGNPAAPAAPTMPGNPAAPAAPTMPGNPAAPAAPTMPGNPAAPAAPTMPGNPAAPAAPTMPGNPAAPAAPTMPGNPAAPAAPTMPGQQYMQAPTVPGQ